ncbi:glycosyltransferase 87 family protein [Streptomyces sp. NBC_01142]|uniref:glycosyltransferase 87 family protein n=1 Tax=Streptomyces sp. NBC_01142 TaxID=2975865 RepID=UPI00225993B8|nr:glycosyltransferase 87 family protein [Streptomyces sp. NBC_01142]MCX4824735.1 glycosyltransferase 87 family protein [Streptomyces sp. NBC_01142]
MTWPTGTRGRLLLVVGLAAAVGLFLATVPLHRDWFDLGVYYGTVDHWVHGGRIYDYLVPGTHYGFTYPPFAAVTMLPMTLVGWRSAVAISLLLNAVAAAAALYWSAASFVRRQGWSRWFTFAVAGCLFALLEPVRDTISFGQVNLLLLALVLADAWLLSTGRGRERFAGLGIGLAAAIKLTPAVFIGYLLITRRWRAAGTAGAVAICATLLALWTAPDASRVYWTEAMWDTDRVGSLAYVSNQSWQGVLARLTEPAAPSRTVWALGVIVLLCVWAWRVRRAVAAGDEWAGFALTGLTACLISPVTWVHHLVWLFPALAVLIDAGLRSGEGSVRRRRLLTWAVAIYVVLCSSVVWLWSWDATGIDGFLGSNTYVWISLGLLLALPLRESAVEIAVEESAHPGPHPEGSATMGACAHATKYPWESRQSAPPVSPTPPASRPAPSGSDGSPFPCCRAECGRCACSRSPTSTW